jgi:PAS domain S-box-containing protein
LRRAQTELEAARDRYSELYDLAPVGDFTVSEQGVILEANLTAATLLGVARGALAGQPLSHFVLPEDQDKFSLGHVEFVGQGVPQDWDLRMVRADGSPFFAHLQATQIRGGACRVALSDVTERRKLEDAERFLLEFGRRHRGEDFFSALARYLAEALGMDYVCIDRLHGDEFSARTVAVFSDGRFEDNVEYALKDTPCGEVVGKTICRFDAGVRQLFPSDAALQQLEAESYVGTTLWSFDGRPIGLIAVVGRRPLANPRLAESVLKLVAVRAAGELERQEAEEKIQAQAKFPSENPNPVLRLGRSGVILYANEAAHGLLRDWGCSVGEAAPDSWGKAVSECLADNVPLTIETALGQHTWSIFFAPIAGAGHED